MSWLALIQSNVDMAFNAVGDLAEAVTIERTDTGHYDPDTGAIVNDPAVSSSFATDCIPDAYSASEANGTTIMAADTRAYVRASKCAFEPTANHRARFRDETWGIVAVNNHARAMYELQLRRPT